MKRGVLIGFALAGVTFLAGAVATKKPFDVLRDQVDDQQKEIATLKKDVAGLRTDVDAMTAAMKQGGAKGAEPINAKIAQAIKEKRIIPGMTLEQANEAMKTTAGPGRLVSENADGEKRYEWSWSVGGRASANRIIEPSTKLSIVADFKGDKIVSVTRFP